MESIFPRNARERLPARPSDHGLKTVYVTLVALNLADVVLECGALVGTQLDGPGDTVAQALADLISDTKIVNHASPKLVGVFDHEGAIDIVYRVRTGSRALSADHDWQSVDEPLKPYDRKLLEEALRLETP